MTFTSSPPRRLRRAAAVHRGVAAAQDDHALADLLDVAERHAREPVDADVNVRRAFLAPGNVEVAAARRAGADENRVVVFGEQRFQAVDALARAEIDAEVEDVADFFVDHRFGQTEARDLRADHAAGAAVAVEHRDVVAERREIARDGERCGPRADERDALAVLVRRRLGKERADVVLVVRGDALQPADRDGLGFLGVALFDAPAAACGLARAVAGAAEDAGEDVRLPVDHVGIAVAACGDQPDVFGNGGVGGTRPLAIDDFMEIVGL